ncbi:MarR family transcriptional regulator [Sphaerisporangium sp. TRM90804]|uniref:MarR family winged helix-turn-helix transcriptional regulator n=1 Tax=Sphaerisporangium sp. TRM90804 TaxID=3031113 RepID=UPI00244CEE47|nr:MarR family transcriptional regulator [Sphaerisporangium sp. TRM90804]MDH2426183.1 MarR family transcriptional regulator [Sphaerisporangium sp. TRM90804]
MHHGERDQVDALAAEWEKHLPPEAVARLELGKRVSRIGVLLEQALKAELAEIGLTYAEFDVLAALRRAGEPYRLRPSELSRSLLLTSGGTSNVLQRLTAAGYVEREADAGDARSRWVRLTERGVRVTERAMAASGRVHEEIMTGIPDEAVRHAADALREILLVLGRRRFR